MFDSRSDLLGKISLGEDSFLELKEVRSIGEKIRGPLFDDRLAIYSPGMLPNTMTPESLPFSQAARNETLTSLLARCPEEDNSLSVYRKHFMDKRGESVPIILAMSEHLSGKCPLYQLCDESELKLTIYSVQMENEL